MKDLYPFEYEEIIQAAADARKQFAAGSATLRELEVAIKENLDSQTGDAQPNSINQLLSMVDSVSMSCMFAQRLIQDVYTIVACSNEDIQEDCTKYTSVKPADPRIAIMTEDNRIIIRFGIIPTARPSTIYMADERDLSAYYHADLLAALNQLDAKRIFALASRPIRIQYTHIFPRDYSPKRMTDNDNYAYKHYTDLITNLLGRSDEALSCTFLYNSVVSDEVPLGTYAIVSPDFGTLLDTNAMLQTISHSKLMSYKLPFSYR